MRKFFIIISSIITGLLIGIIGATIYLNSQSSKVSNFTIRTTNLTAQPKMISYSSNNLPQINLSQDSAVQKFKSLYTHAVGQLPQTEVQGLVACQLALTRTPTCLDTDLTYQQQSFDYCRQRSSNYQSLLSPRVASGLQLFQAASFILGFCHLPNPFSKMFTAAFQSRI